MSLRTDFVAGVEFDEVRVSVDAAEEREVSATSSFASPRTVATYRGLARGRRTIGVSLLHHGVELTSRHVQVDFSGSRVLLVVISRSCLDVVCRPGQTCVGGFCASETCVTGTEAECPEEGCESDAECFTETPCAEAVCASRVCLEVDAHRCAAEEACVPGTGCVPIASPPIDAAVIDSSVVDSSVVDSGPQDAMVHDAAIARDAFVPSDAFDGGCRPGFLDCDGNPANGCELHAPCL